ncbi:MAG: hypothetical protein WBB07_21715 [Mycobacterium sp.]
MTAALDELVQGIVPDVPFPTEQRVEKVLVTGPWLAGVTSLATALAARLPEVTVAEAGELAPGELPTVVVFAVSAAAPLTGSDCTLLDNAAAGTDAVVGAVTKIDAHRRWHEVLDTNRVAVQRHDQRYAAMLWAGVAAAPQLGDAELDDLVGAVREQLGDATLARRNRLRHWEYQIDRVRSRYDEAADDRERVASRLRHRRADLLRERRVDHSERAIALRSHVQQARVQLSYFGRRRCSSVSAELQEDAAALSRRGLAEFPRYVAQRVDDVVGEVNDGVAEQLADVTHGLGLAPVLSSAPMPKPPGVGSPLLRSRRLETRLVVLLGAGFGLGVALTLSRLFADLAPGLAVAGAVVWVLIGFASAVWMVRTRALLQDRAVLDRWVGGVMAETRTVVDQLVATRVLAAEAELTSALADHDEAARAAVAAQIAVIEERLREQALARARAAAVRDAAAPGLAAALKMVQAELAEVRPQGKTRKNSFGDATG